MLSHSYEHRMLLCFIVAGDKILFADVYVMIKAHGESAFEYY